MAGEKKDSYVNVGLFLHIFEQLLSDLKLWVEEIAE